MGKRSKRNNAGVEKMKEYKGYYMIEQKMTLLTVKASTEKQALKKIEDKLRETIKNKTSIGLFEND